MLHEDLGELEMKTHAHSIRDTIQGQMSESSCDYENLQADDNYLLQSI